MSAHTFAYILWTRACTINYRRRGSFSLPGVLEPDLADVKGPLKALC